MFIGTFAWSFIQVSLPFYIGKISTLDAAATLRWTGWILGISSLVTMVMAPFSARIFGEKNPKRSYVATQMLQGGGFFFMAASRTLLELFFSRMLLGFMGAVSTFAFIMVGRSGGDIRRGISAIQSGMTLGQVLGPAAGALVAIPGLVLRHVSRMNVSVLAKSLSAAAHTVFITGCLLGLTLAALRLGYGATEPTTVDRGLLWMVWGTNNTLLLGLVLVFGFGFLLDAGFCWSGLDTLGQAAALLSTAVGLLLIGSGVADVAGISPMTPFLTMAVLGFVLLIRAIDNAPATPTLQSAGRAKSPG